MSPADTLSGRQLRGSVHLVRRPVRLLLRGNRALEGAMHMTEGQSLIGFLDSKKVFLNLTAVRWLDGRGDQANLPHLAIRISQIVWVVPQDPSLALTSALAPVDQSREVQLELVGGVGLEVRLNIADEQRMSDYLDSNPSFLPLRSAHVRDTHEVMERLAVNHAAVLAVREV